MIGGILAGAMTLIAMQVFSSANGPERGGALLKWMSQGVQQLISPDKAAIPNLAGASGSGKPQGAPAQPSPSSGAGRTTEATLPTNPPLISA